MRTRPQPAFLFLDFDGVICDSLEECYRSSWLAAAEVSLGSEPLPNPPFDAAYQARFNACRPFIRSGEDYLVVHEWAAQGRVPEDQLAFDASLDEKGSAVMAQLKKRLYDVRDRLLEAHLSRWLSWNPLYPGMAQALAQQVNNPSVWVLSTKKAEFIVQILAHHGVSWPLERTLYTGSQKKLDMIEQRVPGKASLLIDDQVDHLDFDHPDCDCRLALWGYVSPGAEKKAERLLSLDEALKTISSFPKAHPAG